MNTTFSLPVRRAIVGGTIAIALAAVGATAVTSATAAPTTTAAVATESSVQELMARAAVLTNDNYIGAGSSLTSVNGAYRMDMQDDGNLVVYRTKDNEPIWESGTAGKQATRVHLQADGNMVLYTAKDVAVWDTATDVAEEIGRKTIARMNNDGSLRLERGTDVVWSTPADKTPAPKPTSPKPTSPRPTATPIPTVTRPTATPIPTVTRPTATTSPKPTTSRPTATTSPKPTSARPTATPTATPTTSRPTGTTRPPAPVVETTILPGQAIGLNGFVTSNNGKYRFGLDANGVVYVQIVASRQMPWTMKVKNELTAQVGLNREGNLVLVRRDGVILWSTKFEANEDARLVVQNDGNVVLYHGDDAMWSTNTAQA